MKNSIRITGGEFGSRTIATPGGDTHPMGDRERLAIFNSLADTIHDARVLDMFAGSGALGIEALSRGAKSVVFVDNSKVAREVIKENVERLGKAGKSSILSSIFAYEQNETRKPVTFEPASEASNGTRPPEESGLENDDFPSFDLIFADPPYGADLAKLEIAKLTSYLANDGTLVLSTAKSTDIDNLFSDMQKFSDKTYARARITMWRRS